MPGTQKPLMGLAIEATALTPALARLARATTGAVLGIFGGVVITLSAIVVRARFQHEYLESVDNLIHWQSAPMVLAPAAGVIFGLHEGWEIEAYLRLGVCAAAACVTHPASSEG
ncbi:MAG: hypothetical protein KY464_17920, partial [Gemmatimonadetes bacterium]|nr:hypothetical protein [Gemmatimonadota bacterium]